MQQKKKNTNYPFFFRRWTNKSYAVFNSLHKQIKIGTLSVVYSLVAITTQPLFAQVDTTNQHSAVLEEVTVKSLHQKLLSQTMRTVTVLDKIDIKRMAAHNIQDVLEMVPGIDVRSRGDNGVQADVSIHGGSFDQVLILLNGINITDPQTGHHNLNIPVPLESVERIEVLQGSASRTFGANAFSGAINIITSGHQKNRLQAGLSVGQHAYFSQNINGSIRIKKIFLQSSVSHRKSDGHTKNTDFSTGDYYLQAQYADTTIGKIHWQGAFQNKSFGANSFYSPSFPNQFEHTRTFFSGLSWEKQFNNLQVTTSISLRRLYDHYDLIRDSSYGRNFHRTNVVNVQTKASYISGLGKTSVGITYRNEKMISTALGTGLSNPVNIFFNDGVYPKIEYIKGDNRHTVDCFIDHTIAAGKFSLSTGLLNSFTSDYGNHLYAGVDGGYAISSELKLFASVNQSLRMPTFTELYYKGPGYASNHTIQPEKALTYEIGAKYEHRSFTSSLSMYHRRGKNIIDWVRAVDADPWQSSNITNLNATGVEFFAQYKFDNKYFKKARVDFHKQVVDKNAHSYISKYALDYLKYKIGISIDNTFLKLLQITWQLSYQDRTGGYIAFVTGKHTAYKPIVLFNAKLSYNKPHYTIFVGGSNLLNQSYVDIGNVSQPGRWLKVGINVNI